MEDLKDDNSLAVYDEIKLHPEYADSAKPKTGNVHPWICMTSLP